MDVIFERVDAKRYRIGMLRNGRRDAGADVPVRPGPGGVDVAIPHDLVHFVIEEQLGLSLGIFGQVAAGGGVGFFTPAPADRKAVRDRRRSQRLGTAGRAQVGLSERVAALVDHDGVLHEVRDPELLSHAQFEAIAKRLDVVGDQWRRTPPGQRLVLTWPDPLTIRKGNLPAATTV